MSEHIVRSYDQELAQLDRKIALMGGLAEQQLVHAFEAMQKRNPTLAEQVVVSDKDIDRLEKEIEEGVITMIARRQPLALDLRHVIMTLKLAGDLERIGDLGKNIAKRALAISSESLPRDLMSGLGHMTELALGQLKDVLDAYAERDAVKAVDVWQRDEQIDSMYNSLFRELLTYMMEDPRIIGLCTHLLFGAKNIERIGDHTTNMAENIHFLITGELLDDNRPKTDDTASILFTKPGD